MVQNYSFSISFIIQNLMSCSQQTRMDYDTMKESSGSKLNKSDSEEPPIADQPSAVSHSGIVPQVVKDFALTIHPPEQQQQEIELSGLVNSPEMDQRHALIEGLSKINLKPEPKKNLGKFNKVAIAGLFAVQQARIPNIEQEIIEEKDKLFKKMKNKYSIDTDKLKNKSITHMLLQTKVIGDLKRIDRNINEGDDSKSSDSSESDEYKLEEFDPGAKNQFENKHIFRKNYGVEMELPNMHIIDVKVFPQNTKFILRVVKYAVPGEEFTVKTFQSGKDPVEKSVKEFFSEDIYKEGHVTFELLQSKKSHISIRKHVIFKCKTRVQIKFSPDGRFLAILFLTVGEENYKFKIYEVKSNDEAGCMKLLEDIAMDGTQFMTHTGQQQLFSTTPKICFGTRSKYFCASDLNELYIWKLQKDENIEPKRYILDLDKYNSIIAFACLGQGDDEYDCKIAALSIDCKSVQILDFQKENQELQRIIMDNPSAKPNAEFSLDTTKLIVCTENHVYTLSRIHSSDQKCQQGQIHEATNKKISAIVPTKSDFLLFYHKGYDKNIKIKSTHLKDFKFKISEKISPHGLYRFFDIIQSNQDDEGLGKEMVILTARDSNLNLWQIEPQKCYKEKNVSDIKLKLELKYQGAKATTWPYYAQVDNDNNIWIVNAFDQFKIIKLIMPLSGRNALFHQIFITSEFDLFLMAYHHRPEASEKALRHEMFCIDLDNPRNFIDFEDQMIEIPQTGIFDFPLDLVKGSHQASDIFCRSSSEKKPKNSNHLCMIFALFDKSLYFWKTGMGNTMQDVIKTTTNALRVIDDQSFAFFKENLTEDHLKQEIYQIKCMFSQFKQTSIFENSISLKDRLEFEGRSLDAHALILVNIFKDKEDKQRRKLVVYDLKKKQELVHSWIKDLDLIGQFKANLYKFIDGHLYVENSVFKFRYENAYRSNTKEIQESQLVNKYSDILNLERGEIIIGKICLLSINESKQLYLYTNNKKRGPIKILILPFLHDRKIFLNKAKSDRVFFSTVIEEKEAKTNEILSKMVQIDVTDSKYSVYNEKGILKHRNYFRNTMDVYGEIVQVSKSGMYYLFFKGGKEPVFNILKITTSEGFKWERTIHIKEEITLLLREKAADTHISAEEKQRIQDIQEKLEGDMQHIFIQSSMDYKYSINDNLDFIIEIKSKLDGVVNKSFKQIFPKTELDVIHKGLQSFREEFEQNKQETTKQVNSEKFDFIKRFIGKAENLSQSTKDFFMKQSYNKKETTKLLLELESAYDSMGSMVFVSQNPLGSPECQNCKENNCPTAHKSMLFLTKNAYFDFFNDRYKHGNFCLNQKYIFFYNKEEIIYIPLHQKNQSHPEFKSLKLKVDPQNFDSKIKIIHLSNNHDHISVRIKQDRTSDLIMVWNVAEDTQISFYDCQPDAYTFFDKIGNAYIVNNGTLFNTEMEVELKSFDLDCKNQNNEVFKYQNGYRFDNEDHNWVLFNDYISLSFSFMTLVIRDHFQKQSRYFYKPEKCFDTEMYNYHINRQTFLTCDDFAALNSNALEFILASFEEQDPKLLHLVNYYYEEKKKKIKVKKRKLSVSDMLGQIKSSIEDMIDLDDEEDKAHQVDKFMTPLKKAKENSRSVSVILKYMAKVQKNNCGIYRRLLPEFTENSNFILYLDSLRHQTREMLVKTNLSLPEAYNEKIVGIYPSVMQFIDNTFYRNEIKEDRDNQKYKKFMVKMSSLRVDWIFRDSGRKFLVCLLDTENIEVFRSKTIITITEFMYMHYKKAILKTQLPVYFAQVVVFFLSVNIDQDLFVIITILDVLNLLSVVYSVINLVAKARNQGFSILKKGWTIFDIIYIVILLLISIENLRLTFFGTEENSEYVTRRIRRLQSLLCNTIFGKLLYYLQLIDQVAPLMKIINAIFHDIIWFMLILTITIFGFSQSFYLLGKNQLQFDNIPKGDEDSPEYGETIFKAFFHVYLLSLGDFDTGQYSAGEGSEQVLLSIFFFIASFLLLIHFLNMLIAIMGDTFATTNETKDIFQVKQHLSFVIDNWYTKAIPEKESIRYLITAFHTEDENKEKEILIQIQDQMATQNACLNIVLEKIKMLEDDK